MSLSHALGKAAGDAAPAADALAEKFAAIRNLTVSLAGPLSDADASAQSMADASPAKWHLAHTSWFFETFLLRDLAPAYRLFDARWSYLFNSYYEAEGSRLPRAQRGLLTRPNLSDILRYRAHVDAAMLQAMPRLADACPDLVELGLNHEQQHQELLLADIKHLFFCNPLGPSYWPQAADRVRTQLKAVPIHWQPRRGGLIEVGHDAPDFAFDCETPAHLHFLSPYAVADRPVNAGDWIDFMQDGGYASPSLWLSDGWDWRCRTNVLAPLYWKSDAEGWHRFTLSGWQPVDLSAPVSHISFFEADAFAKWAGARLPQEAEWEAIAREDDCRSGNQLDGTGPAEPVAESGGTEFSSLFGNVWEWTCSAYRPYPGYRAASGGIGEYNGKFMCGQFVLKGGSCATPRGHVRATYRNFFYPHQRWQFTGARLARDI